MKSSILGIWLFLGIFLFINNAATGQDNRTPVGKVTQVQGTVSVSFQGTLRPLQTGDPVFFKDQLRTGPGARLAVILNDDAKLTLGPVSNLTIDEYIYTPQGESPSMKLKLLNGMLRFVGGKLENQPNAKATIDTPVATLGIRGTEVITDTQTHSVWVREGKVNATSKLTGESITLQDDEATVFMGGPCLIMILPRAEKKRRLDYLSFSN